MSNNLISRQDAVEELRKTAIALYSYDATSVIRCAISKLQSLPSAQPEQSITEWQKDFREYINALNIPRDDYKGIMEYINEVPSAQQWIPVTERLPEANEEDEKGFIKAYLVQDARWMDVARWDGKFWIAWGYGTVLKNVTAWMPLPMPFREGGAEECH